MSDIIATEVSMAEFRFNIDGDEEMLKFCADHLDAPDNAKVLILIDGPIVTFELKS